MLADTTDYWSVAVAMRERFLATNESGFRWVSEDAVKVYEAYTSDRNAEIQEHLVRDFFKNFGPLHPVAFEGADWVDYCASNGWPWWSVHFQTCVVIAVLGANELPMTDVTEWAWRRVENEIAMLARVTDRGVLPDGLPRPWPVWSGVLESLPFGVRTLAAQYNSWDLVGGAIWSQEAFASPSARPYYLRLRDALRTSEQWPPLHDLRGVMEAVAPYDSAVAGLLTLIPADLNFDGWRLVGQRLTRVLDA